MSRKFTFKKAEAKSSNDAPCLNVIPDSPPAYSSVEEVKSSASSNSNVCQKTRIQSLLTCRETQKSAQLRENQQTTGSSSSSSVSIPFSVQNQNVNKYQNVLKPVLKDTIAFDKEKSHSTGDQSKQSNNKLVNAFNSQAKMSTFISKGPVGSFKAPSAAVSSNLVKKKVSSPDKASLLSMFGADDDNDDDENEFEQDFRNFTSPVSTAKSKQPSPPPKYPSNNVNDLRNGKPIATVKPQIQYTQ